MGVTRGGSEYHQGSVLLKDWEGLEDEMSVV